MSFQAVVSQSVYLVSEEEAGSWRHPAACIPIDDSQQFQKAVDIVDNLVYAVDRFCLGAQLHVLCA